MAMAPSKGSILLVDDDSDMREAIRDTLEDEGYETIDAASGPQALEYLRAHPAPSVILLDWNMAPMNGSQVMKELAKDAALSKIPVVLLTADAKASDKATAVGFAGYLSKPFNLDALFRMINRYCA